MTPRKLRKSRNSSLDEQDQKSTEVPLKEDANPNEKKGESSKTMGTT